MAQSIQRSFTSGELAPSLRSRADLAKYTSGLAQCENFIVRAQGGAYSRPGTRFVGEIAASAAAARLIPFSFNTEQTYTLVFENLSLQIIQNGAYVEVTPGVRLTVVTPYTTAQLARLQVTQSADVMTIVHPSHDTRSLTRVAALTWTLTVDSFAPSVATPALPTLAAVGTPTGAANKTYYYVVTAVDANGEESLPSPVASITQNALGVTYGVRVTWVAVVGAVYYRIYKDPSANTGVYGWIGDTVTPGLTFDDFNLAPVTSDAPPADNQPFLAVGDKPGAVGYYQQRRVFANTTNRPQTAFLSQTAQYLSLRSSNPSRDADAIEFTIASNQVNEIRHIIDVDGLVMLTAGGVWRITEGQDLVLTPSTVGARRSSAHGASWVTPAIVGDSIVYVQSKGARLRDVSYEFAADKYQGGDLSVTAEHMFESNEILDMTYSEEPYSILWVVRDDGQLIGLTYLKAHEVFAWHRHVTDGLFESVTTISENGRDATYAIVNRTIGGLTKRYVERIEPRLFLTAEESFCVDSGLSYDGRNAGATTMTVTTATDYLPGSALTVTASAAAFLIGDVGNVVELTDATDGRKYRITITGYTSPTVVTGEVNFALPVPLQATATLVWSLAKDLMSGLAHIEGKTAAVLADGNEVQGLVVTGGAITLPTPASVVHIGLPYTCTLDTLDIDMTKEKETLKGKEVSVSRVFVEVDQSRGGWVGPIADPESSDDTTESDMLEIKPRFVADGYDAVRLKTHKQEVTINPEWNLGGGIRVQQRSPLPLTVLSIIPEISVGG